MNSRMLFHSMNLNIYKGHFLDNFYLEKVHIIMKKNIILHSPRFGNKLTPTHITNLSPDRTEIQIIHIGELYSQATQLILLSWCLEHLISHRLYNWSKIIWYFSISLALPLSKGSVKINEY